MCCMGCDEEILEILFDLKALSRGIRFETKSQAVVVYFIRILGIT